MKASRISEFHYQQTFDSVNVILPIILIHLFHLLKRLSIHNRPRVVQKVSQHFAHCQHFLAVFRKIANESRVEVVALTRFTFFDERWLQGEVDQLQQLNEEVID